MEKYSDDVNLMSKKKLEIKKKLRKIYLFKNP